MPPLTSTLVPTSDRWALGLSAAIGWLTVYLLLELARRVRGIDGGLGRLWWCVGATTVGTGLWSMHFLAMTADVLPVPIGYGYELTFVAWLLSVAVAALALSFARRRSWTPSRLAGNAFVVGLGFCVLHLIATSAIDLEPDIAWDVPRSIGAGLAAFAAAAAMLVAFVALRNASGVKGAALQLLASAGVCGALFAANALACAAARVSEGAVCFTAMALDGTAVRNVILASVPLTLLSTLISAIGYGRVDRRRRQLAGSLQNVAARLDSANDQLRLSAMLDPLTRLPNRTLFEDRLAQALLRADRKADSVGGSTEKLGVLFVDLDAFKPVNESFGHAFGDEVLRQVAGRLLDTARPGDTVSRVGGDQFLVLMEGADSLECCLALAARIVDAVDAPLRVVERTVRITASIGIVVYPDHGDRTKLLAQADAAMTAAKQAGRGRYALFESHMHQDIADQLDLVADLRQAIERRELQLHYQPKIDGRRRAICGVEALLRWNHPVRGAVSPATFIPVAERFGFINPLGNWVIEEACRQMAEWMRQGVHMRVAINLSAHQLRDAELVPRIASALERHGVKASHLLCEITESVAMQDIAVTQRTLDALGDMGVYLSIDDFGTGYSSLSYLRQLPARQLKIDRSFIHDLESSDDAKAVVDGVVRLAHALGLRVVAEGVETSSQRDILLGLACDELQGYFFARPMPADRLIAWIETQRTNDATGFTQSMLQPVAA